MAKDSFKIKKSLNIEPKSSPTLDSEGDIAFDSSAHKLKFRDNSATRSVVSEDSTQTLTNKTVDAASNTISNITNSNVSSSAAIALSKLATVSTAKIIQSNSSTGVLEASSVTSTELGLLSGKTGVLVTETGTQILTNKTLTAPVISTISNTGTITIPVSTDTLVGRATTDTLTNKTIDAASNTISNIANSNVSASAAIALSKLAALSTGKVLQSNASTGAIEASSVTNTSLSYLDATSSIQTQLNAKEDSISTLSIAKGGTNNGSLAVTAGGVLYTDGTKVVNVGAGTSTQVLTSNGASAPTWNSPSAASATLVIQTKTANYTAVNTDDLILCSGSAFTVTLYAASGNSGKVLTIQKTDSTLANIITIDANASETINGSLTTTLNTQYETVKIACNGTSWFILDRQYDPVTNDAGAVTITGSTTNPTKGSISVDKFRWQRAPGGIRFNYYFKQSGAGSAGSGDYIFTLPISSVTIDTTLAPTATVIGANAGTDPSNMGPAQAGVSAVASAVGFVSVYSTTQFRIIVSNSGGAAVSLNSALFQLSQANAEFSASGYFPISGWN